MKNSDETQGKTRMSDSYWYTACWNYFALLSGQRMQMLQFFISLEVFLAGAFITLISLNYRLRWAEIVVSALISIMALVFMGLDHRTKSMIHECEDSMVAIEKADSSNPRFNPISCVNNNRDTYFTYSKYIQLLQTAFAIAGIASAFLVYYSII